MKGDAPEELPKGRSPTLNPSKHEHAIAQAAVAESYGHTTRWRSLRFALTSIALLMLLMLRDRLLNICAS